jgi:mono/diheme cytochrome c family protein
VRPFLDDENPTIFGEVSVVDTQSMKTIASIALPNGSQSLRGIACSPNGKYVAVTHLMSQFTVPTMAVARGAMNRNAVSLIRTDTRDWFATLILDDLERGAANPWGLCFTSDGEQLIIAHAGIHELSIVDWHGMLRRAAARAGDPDLFSEQALTSMIDIRQRLALPVAGPRAICEVDDQVYAAGYFSDDLAIADFRGPTPGIQSIRLRHSDDRSLARLGEQYFHDATFCFQHWQSCASCHPDGRADALYWDLLNDGIGNTKNTKSLLMAALTPPAMSRGVRDDAAMAVSSGIRHIQFSQPTPQQTTAMEQYLLEMKEVPSPYLNADVLEAPKTDTDSCQKCHYPGVQRGTLNPSAGRGKVLFEGQAGCAICHPHPYFTSMQTVDGGLGTGIKYDIPSLVEVWRTAPYLHHGDALSLKETLTDFNHLQLRGRTSDLTPSQLDDLLEYLRSL